jgi:hypothetical protein
MTLTKREAATLRAALHCWQNELSYYTTEELRDYYPDLRGRAPLSIDEVERLLARLQADAPQQGGSKATVSSVSVSSSGGGS